MKRHLLTSAISALLVVGVLPVALGAIGALPSLPKAVQSLEPAPATVVEAQAEPTRDTKPVRGPKTRKAEPAREPKTRPAEPRREELRLACEGTNRDGNAAIACKWSASQHPSFAGYELWRGDGDVRSVVFRTRDRDATSYLDGDVRAGVPYMYLVRVLDGDGNVIGSGGPVKAGFREKRPVEELKLACDGVHETGKPMVGCRWSPSASEAFAGYQLWRGGRDGRSIVFRTADRDATHFTDESVIPGQVYVYVIRALDADGAIIASGGPVKVKAAGKGPDSERKRPDSERKRPDSERKRPDGGREPKPEPATTSTGDVENSG